MTSACFPFVSVMMAFAAPMNGFSELIAVPSCEVKTPLLSLNTVPSALYVVNLNTDLAASFTASDWAKQCRQLMIIVAIIFLLYKIVYSSKSERLNELFVGFVKTIQLDVFV